MSKLNFIIHTHRKNIEHNTMQREVFPRGSETYFLQITMEGTSVYSVI